MTKYVCERCLREYESPIPIESLSCARSEDGIEHPSCFMREVPDDD